MALTPPTPAATAPASATGPAPGRATAGAKAPLPAVAAKPQGLALLLGWRRVLWTLLISAGVGLLISPSWVSGPHVVMFRTTLIGFVAMLVFGLFEQWPRRLPPWLARWVLQVVAVFFAMPFVVLAIYLFSPTDSALPFWRDTMRMSGFAMLTFVGMLLTPWIVLPTLLRQRDADARHQALAFELERSELQRKALDARLHLLQAQVEPHFLFNTLANVRALVDVGSPQAPLVLDSLIAYLRAAVPRLNEVATTMGQELHLVRAYLELMHLRWPDRLQYSMQVAVGAEAVPCPPMTLLTLVENAVKHGIDPSEEGGHISVSVSLLQGRCLARVVDSGVGLQASGNSLGTGLSTLRERLQLAFGGDAELRLSAVSPHGLCAEIELPAQRAVA